MIFDLLPTDTISYKLPLSIVLGSLSAGLLQYKLLKGHAKQAHLWIWGSCLGWTVAVLTVFTVDYTKSLPFGNLVLALINLLLILAGGVVLGLITGITLKKITR